MAMVTFGPGTTPGSGGSLPAEVRQGYDAKLLAAAMPALVHAQFCEEHPMDKHQGTTLNMRRWEILTPQLTALTEGVTPDPNSLIVTNVQVSVGQYGDWVEITDLASWAMIDDVLQQASEKLGFEVGQIVDELARNFMVAGTSVVYAGGQTSRNALVYTNLCTSVEIKKSVRTLQTGYAKTYDTVNFIAIIHPYVNYDLESIAEWLAAAEYRNNDALYQGEIGTLYGVRFVISPLAYTVTNTQPITVYCTPVFGQGAFGQSEISGENFEMIVKPLGSSGTSDPMNQRASVAGKATYGGTVLNNAFVTRIESAATT